MKSILLVLSALIFSSCTIIPTNNPKLRTGTDFHMHVHSPQEGGDDIQYDGGRALFAAGSVELNRAVILPNAYSQGATEAYTKQENNFVADQASKAPGRLAGACTTNPKKPWAIAELKRCREMGLKVLKLHFMASGLDLRNQPDFDTAKAFLTEASKFGFTMIVHANYPRQRRGNEIDKLKELIEAFPNSRWIIGHLFGREHAELRNLRHPNFFVEVSVAPVWATTPETRESLLKTFHTVGVEKFVFGSDWPVFHPAEILKYLKLTGLSDSEVDKIVYTNAEKLDDLFSSEG